MSLQRPRPDVIYARMKRAERTGDLPEAIENVEQLAELLSRPGEEVVDLFRRLEGPIGIIGGGGKIGPTLTAMACRARDLAGSDQDIFVVDLFPDQAARQRIEAAGARTVVADLLDPPAVEALPDAANVIYMAGMKFGTSEAPSRTWAMNALIPAYVARRYRDARIVAFSTGCVYDFTPAASAGSTESDPLTPPGEYANSCVARERVLEHCSAAHGTKMALLRLNYAVEMRYGVLVDIANDVAAGRAVDVSMGCFNVIWQGDAAAGALRLLEHAACPPEPINLTGAEKLSVRDVASRLGKLMGKEVSFSGSEADTALLSDAAKARRLLGSPAMPIDRVIGWTAEWVAAGKPQLGKPTHFQVSDGDY